MCGMAQNPGRLAAAFDVSVSEKSFLVPSFDGGGVRFEVSGEPAGYLPYDVVTDLDLTSRVGLFRGSHVVITVRGAGDESMTFGLGVGVDPLAAQRAWLMELDARRVPAEVPALLVRGAQGLDEWLGVLASLQVGGYREAPVDSAELLRVLGEPLAPIEARAAAAWLLLATGEGVILEQALVCFLLHALPPLVVVAAATTAGGDALADGGTRARLARFLPRADASALERHRLRIPRDEARAEAITAALARARHRAEAELEASRVASGPRRSLRGAGTYSAGLASGTSWVGRSWAL